MDKAPLIAVRFNVREIMDSGFRIHISFDNSIKAFLFSVKTLKSFKTKEAYLIVKMNKLIESRNSNFVGIRIIDETTINDWNLLFIYDAKENINTSELLAMFRLLGGNGDD